jgi:hypothetical protein
VENQKIEKRFGECLQNNAGTKSVKGHESLILPAQVIRKSKMGQKSRQKPKFVQFCWSKNAPLSRGKFTFFL